MHDSFFGRPGMKMEWSDRNLSDAWKSMKRTLTGGGWLIWSQKKKPLRAIVAATETCLFCRLKVLALRCGRCESVGHQWQRQIRQLRNTLKQPPNYWIWRYRRNFASGSAETEVEKVYDWRIFTGERSYASQWMIKHHSGIQEFENA